MRFDYKAADGERIEVEWSPKMQGGPAPDSVIVDLNGEWTAVRDEAVAAASLKARPGARIFHRQISVPAIAFPHGQAGRERVKSGRLPNAYDALGNPISRTIGRRPVDPSKCKQGPNGTWEHADGEITNAGGQPVLSSERALDRVLDRTGMKHAPEAFDASAPLVPARTVK